MASGFCSLRLSQLLVCALLGGCSGMPAEPDSRHAAQHSRDLREKQMQSTWVGHPYEDLIQAFGIPNMIMNIPAYRPWKASVVVYEKQKDNAGCIDAFAVEHGGKPVIYDYFCR
jgi:hypothetical protein